MPWTAPRPCCAAPTRSSTLPRRAAGIEVKASPRWRPEYGRAHADLHGAGVLSGCWGVYLGESALVDGPVRVLPLRAFLGVLAAGRVLAAAKRR